MNLSQSSFHFVGVGGIGMSGLAELLLGMGAKVSGSDIAENTQTRRLTDLGAKISIGHDASVVSDQDVIVFSSAIHTTNPELEMGRSRGIPIIPRAEALAEIMRLKRGIAVAGTHGKTTTTSLLASVFVEGDLDPTVVVGGRPQLMKSTARLGQGDWILAEADESDGSFAKLSPEIAVITNIDADHLDHFKTIEAVEEAFLRFAERVPFYGCVIVCGDDPRARKTFEGFNKKVEFYGFSESNDYVIKKEGPTAKVFHQGEEVAAYQLAIPGVHNILNGCAALICGLKAGLTGHKAQEGLCAFSGVDRRFQKVGQVNGAPVIDDYGHHPTEISAVLKAAREHYPEKKVRVVYQPHRFLRTQMCWDQYSSCFSEADRVHLVDIYPAGELPIDGVTSEILVETLRGTEAQYHADREQLASGLLGSLNSDEVLLVMGAGDISQFSHQLVKSCERG